MAATVSLAVAFAMAVAMAAHTGPGRRRFSVAARRVSNEFPELFATEGRPLLLYREGLDSGLEGSQVLAWGHLFLSSLIHLPL